MFLHRLNRFAEFHIYLAHNLKRSISCSLIFFLCSFLFLASEVLDFVPKYYEIPSEMILGYKESKSLTLNVKYHNTLMIPLSSQMDLSPHFLDLYTS